MPGSKFDTAKELMRETLRLSLYTVLFSVATLGLGTGSALAAMYKGLFKTLKEHKRPATPFARFIKEARFTMNQGLKALLFLVGLGLGAILLLSWTDASFLIRLFGGFLAFETVLLAAYIFPALAVFKFPTVLHVFTTAFLMSHYHVVTTIKVALVLALVFFGAFELTPYLLPLAFILYAFLSAIALYPMFMHHAKRIEHAKGEPSAEETPSSSTTMDEA
ncbi:MAG: hypothetical protein ACOCU5_01395 [Bacillota bacterium]